MAFESIDWAPSVIATIQSGNDRPATKKLSASPSWKKSVANPIKNEKTMPRRTQIAKPLVGLWTGSGQGMAHTSFWQHVGSSVAKNSLKSGFSKQDSWATVTDTWWEMKSARAQTRYVNRHIVEWWIRWGYRQIIIGYNIITCFGHQVN